MLETPLAPAHCTGWIHVRGCKFTSVTNRHLYKISYIIIYPHTYIHTLHTYIHTLHYITLHCITLHYITLHCITLHYITLHTIPYHTIPYHTIPYIHTYIYMCVCIICPSIHPYPSIYPSSAAFSPPRFLEGVLSPRPGFVGDADLPDLNGEGIGKSMGLGTDLHLWIYPPVN